MEFDNLRANLYQYNRHAGFCEQQYTKSDMHKNSKGIQKYGLITNDIWYSVQKLAVRPEKIV